jgi:hypothetical protein
MQWIKMDQYRLWEFNTFATEVKHFLR